MKMQFRDEHLWENTKEVMRFRTCPWPNWFLAIAFISGSLMIAVAVYEHIMVMEKWQENLILTFTSVMGLVFLTTGKIRSVVFDKKAKEIQVRKRTITCHCRKVTKY